MPSVLDLIGANIHDSTGQPVLTSLFTEPGVVVGLYYSAYCPPGQAFTVFLAEFYKRFKTEGRSQRFEIVFVSSDKDELGFKESIADMPWHVIPFAERSLAVCSYIFLAIITCIFLW